MFHSNSKLSFGMCCGSMRNAFSFSKVSAQHYFTFTLLFFSFSHQPVDVDLSLEVETRLNLKERKKVAVSQPAAQTRPEPLSDTGRRCEEEFPRLTKVNYSGSCCHSWMKKKRSIKSKHSYFVFVLIHMCICAFLGFSRLIFWCIEFGQIIWTVCCGVSGHAAWGLCCSCT